MTSTIKKFNKQGMLIKKSGGKGKGPGEFTAIRYISSYDKLVYITDQNVMGLQLFDTNLNYIRTIDCYRTPNDFQIITPNQIIISFLGIAEPSKLLVIDQVGKETNNIPYSESNDEFMMDVISFKSDKDFNIYLAFKFKDIIKKIDLTGREIWKKSFFSKIKIKKTKKKFLDSNYQNN